MTSRALSSMDRASGFEPLGCGFDSCRARMRFVKFAIGWPLSAVALFFVARIVVSNSKSILLNLKELNWTLLFLGVVCFFIFYFIRTFTWKYILKVQGYDRPLKKVAFLWEISELKRFVPGNIWSFLGRTSLFKELGIPVKTILKSLLFEIEFILLGSLVISILSIPFIFQDSMLTKQYSFIIAIVEIFLILLIVFSKTIRAKPFSIIKRILPSFSPKTNFFILLTSCLYMFFFGLGTYFVVSSVTYLSKTPAIELTGFFVFSFLVGYLSLITPMGLGVREGVMTLGLAKLLPLTIASFCSIFARIVLISSELCFLLFSYCWEKTKDKRIAAFENYINSHKQETILILFIISYIVYFTTASFLRYDNFYTGRFDLGNMDQTVWNTIHGRIFKLTDPNGTNIISRLAIHADFILILIAPFYLIWENPKMLLLIQTVVLAIGAIFVYAIGKNVIKNKNLSLAFAISFLLNPAVQFTNLYDFHPVVLATTFLLGAFYFMINKRYLWFLLFAILAGLTKEQVWLIVALFGLYIFFSNLNKETPSLRSLLEKRTLGLSIFLASIAIFYYLIWHAMPLALGSKHFALSYYSDFGDSPTKIIKNVILSPQKTIATIFDIDKLHYLLQLLLPLGFFCLLSPSYLIFALPDLFINLLSNNSQLHQIYYQYSATITPFIFIAAMFGIKNLKKRFPKIPTIVYTLYLILITLYSSYAFGPLPFSKTASIDMFTKPQASKDIIENFISHIPAKYSIAATNNIGSHLSHRQKVYTVPVGIVQADIIAFLLDDHFKEPSLNDQMKMVNFVKNDKNYIEVLRIGNFVVFKRFSAFLIVSLTKSTASGFTEIEVIPKSTNFSTKSG